MANDSTGITGTVYVGMDFHKDTIALAVAVEGGGEPRYLGSFPNTPQAVRRQLKKLGPVEHLHCCYEAGPTGYSTCSTSGASPARWWRPR